MTLLDTDEQRWYCYKDNELYFAKADRWEGTFHPLTHEEEAHVIKEYKVVYVDGYELAHTALGSIFMLENSIIMYFGSKVEVSYDSIEVLHSSLEREITALRTFLAGPLFAALAKKETLSLTIGFRDELGLLQLPSFTMAKNDIEDCHAFIKKRITDKKVKHISS